MKEIDIVGKYTVVGSNQDASDDTYKGELFLSIDDSKRITAKWIINTNQLQLGNGFFKDNILVINFYYKNDDHKIFTGTVVYKCLTKDILEGFWFEEAGNPLYLGYENCFKVKNNIIN
ncbi:hypothetical protein [Polaribacter sp. R77954]|uniref:hypothetical protein n=1 Tax=Polaribacter sp. R77954 TaxID=3093870 RepID=UPI0037CB7CD0